MPPVRSERAARAALSHFSRPESIAAELAQLGPVELWAKLTTADPTGQLRGYEPEKELSRKASAGGGEAGFPPASGKRWSGHSADAFRSQRRRGGRNGPAATGSSQRPPAGSAAGCWECAAWSPLPGAAQAEPPRHFTSAQGCTASTASEPRSPVRAGRHAVEWGLPKVPRSRRGAATESGYGHHAGSNPVPGGVSRGRQGAR